ncbi:MAG: sugar phosphate isomerase/epimerase [Lachnospiraceae bacterium]|nr:sugar phosphate isomerase/epimerase [Lachnospiraceae bacterium]
MIYISHLLPDEQMRQIIQETGFGIESIDFSISDNLDCLEKSIEVYRKKLESFGTEHLTLHGPFLDVNPCAYDSLVRKATLTRFDQCYQAGLALGAKKIVFHSGMNPYVYYKEGWAEHVTAFWSEFLQDHQELEIVLENVFDDDWRLLLDVYQRVNRPNFKLCLDIGHAHCYSSLHVLEWTEHLAPYVTHVHVHDNSGDRDAHTGLGKGNLPWKEVLTLLPETEERTWTIECMREEDVWACAERMKEWQEA